MRRVLIGAALLCAAFVLAPQAWAEDVFQPPWDRATYPTATYQAWEFTEGWNPAEPEVSDNPYGLSLAWIVGGEYGTQEGLEPGDLTTWHIADPAGGTVTIHVFNDPNAGVVKEVLVQLTSSKAPDPEIGSNPPGSVTSPSPHHKWGDTNWYTYNFFFTIPGNPAEETLTFKFPFCTVIDEIVVDTRCVPIPEPGLLALSGLGALLFFRRK